MFKKGGGGGGEGGGGGGISRCLDMGIKIILREGI